MGLTVCQITVCSFAISAVCRPLVAPQFGSFTCDRDLIVQGTNCTFQCQKPSYKLMSGEASYTLQCTKEAVWNGSEPVCIRKLIGFEH